MSNRQTEQCSFKPGYKKKLLYLYQANRLENLSELLCSLLRTTPLPPFEPETIVVQHHGMAQWLQRNIAGENDIAANLNFPLPARFFGEVFSCFKEAGSTPTIPGQQQMDWQIFFSLPDFLSQGDYQELNHYLSNQEKESKQYQLAKSISSLFDKYAVYRPDLFSQWREGNIKSWQAGLYRYLHEKYEYGEPAFNLFLKTLKSGSQPITPLPKRGFLFSINGMPPIYLELLDQLSRYMELHLFHLSPCREYWGDIESAKELAKKRNRAPRQPRGPESGFTGNSLLSSWGNIGRDFLDQVLGFNIQQHDQYIESPDTSLLHTIQQDILLLEEEKSTQPFVPDQSLQFHTCHSPLREVQVLHDQLLKIFEHNPKLTAGDILVTAPDIHLYNGAIQSVFENCSGERRIPYHLADRSQISEAITIQGYLDLLALFHSRITAPELFALLEIKPLAAKFNLQQADLHRLQYLIEQTNIRWGLDAAHRGTSGLTDFSENTWLAGLDQLLLGYLMGSTDAPFANIFPFGGITAADEKVLGGLGSLLQQLQQWLPKLNTSQRAEEWPGLLVALLHSFFDQESDENGFQLVAETITDWEQQLNSSEPAHLLPPTIVCQHINSLLSQQPANHPFLTGRVTFCNMVPMRAVPFQVICILGMNDGAFPRSQQPVSFDLTMVKPRRGDRDRRNDDRYLFLEMLLSADKILYLSWTGQNQHDAGNGPPSTVLCELQEYLDRKFSHTGPLPSEQLTTIHPSQPFSPLYFEQGSSLQSYGKEWMPTEKKQKIPPFLPAPLAAEKEKHIDIAKFAAFWRHPVRFFLEERVGLRLHVGSRVIEENEPFSFNQLEKFQLRQHSITTALQHQEEAAVFKRLHQSGALPAGQFGSLLFEEAVTAGRDTIQAVQDMCNQNLAPLEIDIHLDSYRLSGWLNQLYPKGRITWRSGAIKGATLMELWVYHLLLCSREPSECAPVSIHLAKDNRYTLKTVGEPERYLKQLIDLFECGNREPLHFFPESAYAFATAEEEKKMQKAVQKWCGSNWSNGPKGEYQNQAYQLLFPDDDLAPLNEEFIELATLFSPLLEHLEM